MSEYISKTLQSYGVEVELRPLGKQMMEGQELDLPPAILGSLGNDPKKVNEKGHTPHHLPKRVSHSFKLERFSPQTANNPSLRSLRYPTRFPL